MYRYAIKENLFDVSTCAFFKNIFLIHIHTYIHTYIYIYIYIYICMENTDENRIFFCLFTKPHAFWQSSALGTLSTLATSVVNPSHTDESWEGRNTCLWIYLWIYIYIYIYIYICVYYNYWSLNA